MTWRDRLVPASFDGAAFFVDSMELDQGRRTFVQKFPGTARVEVQDLGEDSREFTVNAYLIGPNYDFDRDVLEAALREGGVKPLTLPWRGTKNVTVDQRFKTTESKSEGGFCRISFHAVEDVPEEPFSRVSRPAQVDTQASVVEVAAKADMTSTFTVAGLPSAYQVSSLEALTEASDSLRSASDRIAGVTGQLNDAARAISDFAADAEALMSTPGDLAEELGGVVTAALGVAGTALDALELASVPRRELARLTTIAVNAALEVLDFAAGIGAPNTGSANGTRESTNLTSITATTQLLTISGVCRLTTTLPFESYSQAQSVRSAIVDAFDTVTESLGDNVIDAALLLQAYTVQHLDAVAAALPELRTYTTRRMISLAEVAHDIYGDASRVDEIADRNGLGAPLFVPAGTALELLSV